MGWLIALGVAIVVIAHAIEYWQVTLAVALVGFLIFLLVKANDERKLRRARLFDHRMGQIAYRKQMLNLGEESMTLFERIPSDLRAAEELLDQATIDFNDGVFAPFWDSIENAAKALGRFAESLNTINARSSSYTELANKYKDVAPHFPLSTESIKKLGAGTATAERMRSIVRKAQTNFQFASIYEQRKTNQILVAGFTSLAHALERMTNQITESIDDLAKSTEAASSALDESLRAASGRLGDASESTSQILEELQARRAEAAVRETKVLKMLDNIQRGRRPGLSDA